MEPLKATDRIWALASERCAREGRDTAEATVMDVAAYLDEQRDLVIITAPEHASEAEIGKLAESLEHLAERHDIVIVPFGAKVTRNGQVVHGMPERMAPVVAEACPLRRGKHGDPWKFHHPACKKPDAHEGSCIDPKTGVQQ